MYYVQSWLNFCLRIYIHVIHKDDIPRTRWMVVFASYKYPQTVEILHSPPKVVFLLLQIFKKSSFKGFYAVNTVVTEEFMHLHQFKESGIRDETHGFLQQTSK